MPEEACGIFGAYAPGENIPKLVYFGILALQHRGQESSGISTSDTKKIRLEKQQGRVDRFTEKQMKRLNGQKRTPIAIGIGHNRYSNTGSSIWHNYQPFVANSAFGEFSLAHNGNLINPKCIAEKLGRNGFSPKGTSDSELIALLISFHSYRTNTFEEAISSALKEIKGAFSLVIMSLTKLYGIRDPWGIRPLTLGQLNGSKFVLASESCALEAVGAKWLKDLEPGQMVVIEDKKFPIFKFIFPKRTKKLCIFEIIYFASPGSIIYRRLLQTARRHMGEILWKEHPVEISDPGDWVVGGVPDTGTPAAKGYAEASGLEVRDIFIKNRYVGRTFINPDQRLRDLGVRAKLQALGREVVKKNVVVVEDSIVRATTSHQIVKLLREAGANEVHLRITSPPYRHRCLMGIDTQYTSELIAATKTVEEIRRFIDADSLGYLSFGGLVKAIDKEKYLEPIPETDFCAACFTGKYPFRIPNQQGRFILE